MKKKKIVLGVILTILGMIGIASLLTMEIPLQPSLAARFLYGGFTEEILLRFGFMTLMVWVFSKVFNGIKPVVYWVAILIASLVFALGHFPIVYQAVENPSVLLLMYLMIGNSFGGIVFGWLY